MEAKSTDKILHNKNDNSVTTRNSKIRNNILMISLNKFYENPENLKKFNKILNGDSKISLRIIDWFVTNYSKKNNTTFVVYTKGKTMKRDHFEEEMSDTGKTSTKLLPKQKKLQFNVYVRYKAQLKSYSKKSFDTFCRKDRINDWGTNKDITTTIGQLNFFKWAIQNNVIDYIEEHHEDIEKDMNSNIRKKKTQIKKKEPLSCSGTKKTEKVKRTQLSQNATKLICKMNTETLVEFD